MSEIVDRVAKALYASDETVRPWELQSPGYQSFYLAMALLMLKTIREPTDEMLRPFENNHFTDEADTVLAVEVWRSMIDEALK